MASLRKRARCGTIGTTDADASQHEGGCTDERETEGMLANALVENSKIRNGYIDERTAIPRPRFRPLTGHIAAWQADLVAQGFTAKHAEHTANRVRRLVAVMLGSQEALIDHRRLAPKDRGDVARKVAEAIAPARLSILTREKVQGAIARLKAAGWSLRSCNHYRASARAFSAWCHASERTREDALRGVKGYNAKEDRRHDRRAISLDELRRLIEAAQDGPMVAGMSGPARSICYRLAVASGLRYAELSSLTVSRLTSEPRT